jgi:hypothetical protein
MKYLKLLFLCLFLGNVAQVHAKQKPITFRIFIADSARPRVTVIVKGSVAQQTDGAGKATIQRGRCQGRDKGDKVKLTLIWKGTDTIDRRLDFYKDTIIKLDDPITEVRCSFEPLRKREADAAAEKERLVHLDKRKKELLVAMKDLENRVVTHLRLHPESLMSHYGKWLKDQIAAANLSVLQMEQELDDLEQLRKHLFENDVLVPDVEKELNESESLRQVVNPTIEPIEKVLPEITLNLDNDPDEDLKSEVLFDPGKDALKPTAQMALEAYVAQKIRQLQAMFAKEGSQLRQRVCVLSVTGYADAAAMKDLTLNNKCPANYQDREDGNLCLSWRRANTVKTTVEPLFGNTIAVNGQLPVGMGSKYALNDPNKDPKNQEGWRKCTISAIYMSKSFYEQYVGVPAQQANGN